nr:uncharacterized protein LOC112803860 [Arachis hypogaea]
MDPKGDIWAAPYRRDCMKIAYKTNKFQKHKLALIERKCFEGSRNNECPICRTHYASHRSLRDDPKYDAFIATLYLDIKKYEKEFDVSSSENIGDTGLLPVPIPNESTSIRSPTALLPVPAPHRNTRKLASRGRGKRRTVEEAPVDDYAETETDEDPSTPNGVFANEQGHQRPSVRVFHGLKFFIDCSSSFWKLGHLTEESRFRDCSNIGNESIVKLREIFKIHVINIMAMIILEVRRWP